MLFLLVLFLAAGIFIYLKAPAYINENLSEWVNKKSGGTYDLQFDKCSLSIRKWGFTFENIQLQPVDSIVSQADSTKAKKVYYKFFSPELNIRNIGLLKLFVLKKLEIGKVDIVTPDLQVLGSTPTETTPGKNIELLLKEMEPVLRHQLRSIRIKNIELIDANYNSYNFLGDSGKASNAGHITIGVKKFYTDSILLANPDQLFDAEDVFIKMTDYKNQLKDSLHILSADEMYYSLKKAVITGKNVVLQPLENIDNQRNQYIVKVPFLRLKSDHIQEFYTSDSIRVDSLSLDKATIEFYPRQKSTKITLEHISNFNLYELVGADFRSVAINHFILNQANVKLFNFKKDYFLQQEMGKMNLELEYFQLDSVSIDDQDKIFYSDKLKLVVDDYKITLGDGYHQLEIGNLSASTDDRFVRIYQAKVRPNAEDLIQKNNKIAIIVDCDSLKIKDADLKQAFHSRRLPIGGVELYKPVTSINRYDKESEKSKKSSSLVYELISSYFRAIYANLVTLESGKLVVNDVTNKEQPGHIESEINFQLTDFALDSVSAVRSDKLFFASNIDLAFSNYDMQLVDQLHRVTIEKIDISSSKRKATIEQFHLFPITHENTEEKLKKFGNSELYEVKIPYLFFLNTDIHQAFFNKKLTIGNIRIIEPKINFESFANLKIKEEEGQGIDEFYKLLSNYIKDIDIRQIEAKDGQLKLTNHDRKGKTIGFDNKFNLILDKFRLNKDEIGKHKLLFSENIDLKIKKYLFRLSDKVHYLQADEIGLSTFDSRVYMYNAILYPDITNPDYKKLHWNILLTIPSVSISGVDLLGLYFDGKLSAKDFTITNPDIKLYKVNDEKKNFDFKEFSLLLPNEIREISINKFLLKGGELQLLKEIDNNHLKYLNGFIGMQANDLKIVNDKTRNSSNITSEVFTTKLKNIWFEPIGKNQRIELEMADYSTNSKKISLKNLSITPKNINPTKNQFIFSVPDIQLNSFNIDLAYTKDQYFFEQIALSKPEFIFYKNTTDSSRFNPYTINLYTYFKDFADVFSTKQLTLEDASFLLHTKEKTIEQSGIDMNLSGFKVDKNNDRRFLFSDQFEFSFNNVTRYDRKKMYKFQFEKLGFSSLDNHFVVSGIHIEPQYSKEKFSQRTSYQTDYFTGSLQEIRFENMDLERWFDKQEVVGKRLQFKGLEMDVYRDKRIPFNEKQRPPMPQDLLRNFDLKFYFDSLELSNANISYAEQIEESPEAGRVDFKNINARLKPFTNIPYLIGTSGKSQLDVSGNLMGGPVISARVNIDMASPINSFELTGNIATCPMDILNPMTKPAALMEINTGTLEKFEFHFTGDNELAKGKLKFAYDDLNISILEIKDGSAHKSKFSSFLANSLMIKSKNPRGKILLPDDINYKRDPSRSILNFWWKSIFDGVKNTFGIKDKEEE